MIMRGKATMMITRRKATTMATRTGKSDVM